MGIKNKIAFSILILAGIFFAYADSYNWYDSILRNKYTDHQISYWNKIIVEAKQHSKPTIKSDTETVYSYNGFVITENTYNKNGKFSKGREPSIVYKMNNSSSVSISVFVEKNGDITLQIWGHGKRILTIQYYNQTYDYTYFADGEMKYNFKVAE